jgi:DNA primase small subunit
MNVDSKFFLRKRFKDYYWSHRVSAPSEVHRREFGVGTLEDKIKVRHKAFASERELETFLKREAPSYISYSSAYYEFPENQPMSAKNWLGADLVFDLDAPMEYFSARVFDDVKRETLNLMDFLTDDFGFPREEVSVNFSGSKGYHVHVKSENVRCLSGDARRQIVDYVTGSGLDLKCFMKDVGVEGFSSERMLGYVKSVGVVRGPTAEDVGWARRIYGSVRDFIANSTLEDFMRIEGIGQKRAKRLVEERKKNLKALDGGNWEGIRELTPKLLQRIVDERAVTLTGDADKMVTIDTSRLMRLPDTIHGGSGLLAARVNDLEVFNPLVDAVVFSEEETRIKPSKDMPEFDLMGGKWGPYRREEEVSVPEYVGVYLMLKDAAEIYRT